MSVLGWLLFIFVVLDMETNQVLKLLHKYPLAASLVLIWDNRHVSAGLLGTLLNDDSSHHLLN